MRPCGASGDKYVIILLSCLILRSAALNKNPLLIIISFDGFRYDVLNSTMVPHIYNFALGGSWFVNGSQSQYVSFTAPNHMSMATGLYEESHGIVSNFFYDTDGDEVFDYFNYTGKKESSLEPRWYLGEPIWISNERGGQERRSAVLDWPMADASYSQPPHKPTYVRSWSGAGNLTGWIDDVDTIIELFTREKDPVNLVNWYIAQPDTVLHKNGFYNGEFKKTITDLDKAFDYFITKVRDRELDERLNIILTADHGHAEIKDYKSVLCMRDYVQGDGFFMGDHMVYPRDEQHGIEVFSNLSRAVSDGFDVEILWKKDVPDDWHYTNTSRVGKIVINPRIGASISFSCNKTAMDSLFGPNGTMKFNSSTHGMDPHKPEMRAILIARGPLFSQGKVIAEIPENVDLYPMFCHILGVLPAPNNGTMNVMKMALKTIESSEKPSFYKDVVDMFSDWFSETLGYLVVVLPTMCMLVLMFVYAWNVRRIKEDPNWTVPESARGYNRLALRPEDDAEANIEEVRMSRIQQATAGAGSPGKLKPGVLVDGSVSEDDL